MALALPRGIGTPSSAATDWTKPEQLSLFGVPAR